MILVILIALVIFILMIYNRKQNFTDPTTKIELITEKVYESVKKNIEDQGDFDDFILLLKKEGVRHPKIDVKFYTTASTAYQNRLLTRDYIANRLN